jgi:3-dehydroquinate dehydratase-1
MSLFLGYEMEPGLVPLVVGVISTPGGLEKATAETTWPCDVIEIRLDLIGDEVSDWPVAALRLTKAGVGTILTIRHPSEGGRWRGDDNSRMDCYVQGLPLVTGIDIELRSAILPDVVAMAKGKVTIIGSHHQFRGMPEASALQSVVKEGVAAGVDVIKIAAFAADKNELSRLSNLLKKNSGTSVCALAMGPMGLESRVSLPMAGSCLTYGYLDKPNAPGQPNVSEIREELLAKHEEYRVFTEIRSELGEQ